MNYFFVVCATITVMFFGAGVAAVCVEISAQDLAHQCDYAGRVELDNKVYECKRVSP